MLRTETVEKGTLDLIRRLMADKEFKDFNLVGGTALALKIGHRKSIDIDLFTTSDFNAKRVGDYLARNYGPSSLEVINNGVACFIDDVKVDILAHRYPLVKNAELVDGVRMISQEDIGAMKLSAIYNNGTRVKDFVDVYFMLERFSLGELVRAFEVKYPDINKDMLTKSLVYFGDVRRDMPVDYIGRSVRWEEIEERLNGAVRNQGLVFGRTQFKELKRKGGMEEGRGKGFKF
jgi:hypothetical protein